MLTDLIKATIGVAVETPIAIVADVVTLCGTLSDKEESYTASAIKNVMENVENATKPRRDEE